MTTKPTTRQAAPKTPADAAVKPAETFNPSGGPNQTTTVDPSSPALDANPREGTTDEQNRIDLNDPSLSDAEAVARNLGYGQGEKD